VHTDVQSACVSAHTPGAAGLKGTLGDAPFKVGTVGLPDIALVGEAEVIGVVPIGEAGVTGVAAAGEGLAVDGVTEPLLLDGIVGAGVGVKVCGLDPEGVGLAGIGVPGVVSGEPAGAGLAGTGVTGAEEPGEAGVGVAGTLLAGVGVAGVGLAGVGVAGVGVAGIAGDAPGVVVLVGVNTNV